MWWESAGRRSWCVEGFMDKQYFRLTSRDTSEIFRLIKQEEREQEIRHLGSFDLVMWL